VVVVVFAVVVVVAVFVFFFFFLLPCLVLHAGQLFLVLSRALTREPQRGSLAWPYENLRATHCTMPKHLFIISYHFCLSCFYHFGRFWQVPKIATMIRTR
jgi:hypothetical protein